MHCFALLAKPAMALHGAQPSVAASALASSSVSSFGLSALSGVLSGLAEVVVVGVVGVGVVGGAVSRLVFVLPLCRFDVDAGCSFSGALPRPTKLGSGVAVVGVAV